MKKKNQKLFILVGVLLLFGGISLSYFVSKAILGGNGGSTSVTTAVINGATLNVEGVLSFEDLDILPGHKTASAIKVTATGNNELIPYNLIWQGTNTLTTPLNFTIYKTSEQLSVTSTCSKKTKIISGAHALSEECSISNLDKLGNEIASGTINKNETKVTLVKDEFITAINSGISYYYYIILEYPNLDEPQNEDLNGTFEGEVTVEESNIKPDINILAAYIEEDGKYKEVEDIPQEGYTINTEKSTCSNGAIPSWDNNKNGLFVSNLNKSGTSCYLYFDKYVLVTVSNIIASFGEAGGDTSRLKSGDPTFNVIATGSENMANNGIYMINDEIYGGISYYWRGAATTNHIIFANKCWRIIRINGDKSLRLIYNGLIKNNGTCAGNGDNNSDSLAITNKMYNSEYHRSEYVGYTYSQGYQRSTAGISSIIKTETDLWFDNNIANNEIYAKNITNGKFCNDRNVRSDQRWSTSPNYTLYYSANQRMNNYSPNLSCNAGDVYLLKVGQITADEVMLAGGASADNKMFYLYNAYSYWTMSPSCWVSSTTGSYIFVVNENGFLGSSTWKENALGIRPVINLRSDVTFSGGDGTIDNPYVVTD